MEVDPSEPCEASVRTRQARSDREADSEVEDAMKNGLKRSNSAPLINQLVAAEVAAAESGGEGGGVSNLATNLLHSAAARLKPSSYQAASCRWRRKSTSFSPVSPGGGTPGTPAPGGGQGVVGAGWARLNRLKVEETEDVGKLEIQAEREVQRGISIENNLSQSWEDLSLCDNKEAGGKGVGQTGHAPRRVTDPMVPLTIGVGPFPSPRTSPSPSPSPTRSSSHPGKQCFSPSMQMPVPNLSFSPSPSSSPTRRGWTTRRSLSPITLRPSPLGPVKRKCMLDSDSEREAGVTPSKRHSSLLSITHQNSFRSAPYRLPLHVQSGWATPSSSPSHSAGPPSDCSRESSPSPALTCDHSSPSQAPSFPLEYSSTNSPTLPLEYPSTNSPSLMDTSGSTQTETSL